MANLLDDLVYVTLDDVRETSRILASNAKPTDTVLTQLITESQWVIETYIGSYGEKEDEAQAFIFPTVDDGIPNDIKLATVRIAEQLYLQGDNLWSLKGDRVVSESNLSRSVSYSDKEWHISSVETINIPKKALNVLDKYKSSFIWQVI